MSEVGAFLKNNQYLLEEDYSIYCLEVNLESEPSIKVKSVHNSI